MSEGELGQRISNMIGFLEEEKQMTLVAHRVNIIEILEDAKADFQKMYDEANKTFVLSFEEETQIWDAWFEKWFVGKNQTNESQGIEKP